MRKLTVTFLATGAILLAGSLAFKAEAQTSRGAAIIPAQAHREGRLRAILGPLVRTVPPPRLWAPWPLLVRALLNATGFPRRSA